jgi:hypothetical protein
VWFWYWCWWVTNYRSGDREGISSKHSCCSLFSGEEGERERERDMDMEMKQSRFKRICVFCGSSPGKKSSYKDAAIELGKELVINKNKICLSVLAPVSFLQFNLFFFFFFFFFSLLSDAFFSGFLGFVS